MVHMDNQNLTHTPNNQVGTVNHSSRVMVRVATVQEAMISHSINNKHNLRMDKLVLTASRPVMVSLLMGSKVSQATVHRKLTDRQDNSPMGPQQDMANNQQ